MSLSPLKWILLSEESNLLFWQQVSPPTQLFRHQVLRFQWKVNPQVHQRRICCQCRSCQGTTSQLWMDFCYWMSLRIEVEQGGGRRKGKGQRRSSRGTIPKTSWRQAFGTSTDEEFKTKPSFYPCVQTSS